MGSASVPDKAMLFSSVLYHANAQTDRAITALEERFGRAAFSSDPMPFTYTDYYCQEMGRPLFRFIIAFSDPVPRDSLPDIKLATNEIETRFIMHTGRTINIDPGILSQENVCLASTKPYSHRIYLGKGIWAEITLIFQGKSYRKLEWTYPDYASDDLIRVFNHMRTIYREGRACRKA